MRLLFLLISVVAACKYEYECNNCTTCFNNTCVRFDVGESCTGLNESIKEFQRDLELYYEFYYSRKVHIEEYRCNDYGISIRYTKGMTIETNMSKDYFNHHYKVNIYNMCEGWVYKLQRPQDFDMGYGINDTEFKKSIT